MKKIASVGVSNTGIGYDRRYKYLIPPEMEEKAFIGGRVVVPFGKGNRKRIGVILSLKEADTENLSEIKPVIGTVDDEPLLNAEALELMMWIRETTLCTYFEAFKTLIPTGLSVIATDDGVKRRVKNEKIKMVRLSDGFDELNLNLTPKKAAAVDVLKNSGAASLKELKYICNMTSKDITAMIAAGAFEAYEYEEYEKSGAFFAGGGADGIELNGCQAGAFDGVASMIDKREPAAALLYGVTGSGKTSVYIRLIDYTLKKGLTAILLIPEISLTPQAEDRFRACFGDLVSVTHSGLSLTQRLKEYNRVKSGVAKIVIGTRSAVFAPLENIGLIIIDEEGEPTYKSESAPKYNAREIAKKRCVYHNAVFLAGSATPSVESFYYAMSGRYKLFRLDKRYGGGEKLPAVRIIDLAQSGFVGGGAIFSPELAEEININLERGEQTVLLLNRRGYHTYVSCSSCGQALVCPSCSIPLTYHRANGRVICHYCGHSADMPEVCPECGGERLKLSGTGTQRVEDETAKLFPDARILRMDADTTGSRLAYEKSFKSFGEGEYDIMLGTQMIAKGLDFPNVTLVGALSVDKALFSGDFRSYERTFSLITQTVGRSGRGDKSGRALIQTFVPEHYIINYAAAQDYGSFYEEEAAVRKALIYPPFCDTCLIEFSAVLERRASEASNAFLAVLREKINNEKINIPLRVLGPAKALHEKLGGKYRYRIILKCKNNAEFRNFIREAYKKAASSKECSGVGISLDINGNLA